MTAAAVRRRQVYFLGGFDPKGAAYYHALYAAQAALAQATGGARYTVGARQRQADGNSVWRVDAESDGQSSETLYEYVRWDDIVRARWPRTPWRVLTGSLRGYAAALSAGRKLLEVWRVAPKTLVSLAWPAAFWLAALLLAGAGGLLAGALAGRAGAAGWLAGLLGFGVAGALGAAVLAWERRVNTSWLLRIYSFAGDWSLGRIDAVEPRMARLAAGIDASLADPAIDEVLLVGFSVGGMLAATAAARLTATVGQREKFSLLTLGHCIPLLGAMPGAARFRADLAALAGASGVDWRDVSSPLDWGSFALIDPLPLCLGEAAAAALPRRPLMLSPRFHTLFSPATYARIRGDKRRMHLQYLMAGELPGAYDYFAITAGPRRLAARWPLESR